MLKRNYYRAKTDSGIIKIPMIIFACEGDHKLILFIPTVSHSVTLLNKDWICNFRKFLHISCVNATYLQTIQTNAVNLLILAYQFDI